MNKNNRKVFFEMMDETISGKSILGIICQGYELEGVKVRSVDELKKLKELKERPEVNSIIPKSSIELKNEKEEVEEVRKIQVKPICLLMAYMHGVLDQHFDMNDQNTRRDLETILRAIPSYLDILLVLGMFLSTQFRLGQTKKRITCRNIISIIEFSKNLM